MVSYLAHLPPKGRPWKHQLEISAYSELILRETPQATFATCARSSNITFSVFFSICIKLSILLCVIAVSFGLLWNCFALNSPGAYWINILELIIFEWSIKFHCYLLWLFLLFSFTTFYFFVDLKFIVLINACLLNWNPSLASASMKIKWFPMVESDGPYPNMDM